MGQIRKMQGSLDESGLTYGRKKYYKVFCQREDNLRTSDSISYISNNTTQNMQKQALPLNCGGKPGVSKEWCLQEEKKCS